MKSIKLAMAVVVALMFSQFALAEDEAELAKKLANPVASLISVPIQANYDENIGPDEGGSVWRINIQPVIPITISQEWNLISRTILPIIDQEDIPLSGEGEFGIGDIVQSFFFSPSMPTAGGLTWGVGPVLLLPSASDEALGAEKWGIGPTVVGLKQKGPWTIGALVNHIESFAGDGDRKAEFEEGRFKINPGDKLFVYSDGIVEYRNHHEELYGENRFFSKLKTHGNEPVSRIVEDCLKDLFKFGENTKQQDDITLVGVEMKR